MLSHAVAILSTTNRATSDGKISKWTDDGWPKVWAEMSDEELRDRLRHYLLLAANSPLTHAKRIAQLVAEADKRGKAEMVNEAMEWVKSHEPSKQE
jgi:hypothetical protein